jgi:membrane protease YdiL (CAAX protease family)
MESVSTTKPAVNRWRWWIHLILITGYLLLVGFLGLRRTGTRTAVLSETVGGLLSVCGLESLFFGLIFGLACFASRATRDDLLLRWQGGFKPLFLGVGYSVALRVAVGLAVIAIGIVLVVTGVMTPESLKDFFSSNRPDVEAVVNVEAMRHNPVYFWLTVTVVSLVVAGLREELWRSAFLAALKALWPQFGTPAGKVLAVIICAVIFALGHLAMGPVAVFLAGLIGVGLGLIMVFHGSIWPAVIAHGLFDATSMAMLPWALNHITNNPS